MKETITLVAEFPAFMVYFSSAQDVFCLWEEEPTLTEIYTNVDVWDSAQSSWPAWRPVSSVLDTTDSAEWTAGNAG